MIRFCSRIAIVSRFSHTAVCHPQRDRAPPLNLAEAVYLIADAIRPLLASKQQTLTIDLPPDLP